MSPCQIGIITCGNESTLLFLNAPHMDMGDKFSPKTCQKLISWLNTEYKKFISTNVCHEEQMFAYKLKTYLETTEKIYQLGVPTTCAYQHVMNLEGYQLIQFFVMEGLGCSVFIQDFIGHNFWGHVFLHNTSLCIALDKSGRVWLTNKKHNIGHLFGWGGGGDKDEK